MISIQKIADALTGRRIAVTAAQDDARRELKACGAELALAQSQIAGQGREIVLLQQALTDAVKIADQHRSQVASLRAANQGLIRLADGRQPAAVRTTAVPEPDEQLRRQAEQDRRNVVALEDRIDSLLRENEDLLKALAG